MIRQYTDVLRRFKHDIAAISDKTGVWQIRYWLDAFICYILHGASPRDYTLVGLYRLNNMERKSYLTMRRAARIEKWFNSPMYADVFNHKQIFNRYFSQFVRRDWIYAPDHDAEEIEDFCKRHDSVIVKPTDKSSGKGIRKAVSSRIGDMAAFAAEAIRNKLLLEECIRQRSDMSELNPHSVNTLRIYTCITRGGVAIIGAGLRAGTTDSPVDNMHDNGVYYPIDPESGMIIHRGMDILGRRHIYHPSSGGLMLGYTVSGWDEIRRFVLRAAEVIPQSRYIGWDVALTDNGCEMIEGNYNAYIADLQVYDNEGLYKLMKTIR